MTLAYTTGDTVVHPRHGVATVRGIANRDMGNGRASFLELVFDATSLKILVPVDAVDEVGIRPLPTKGEAAAILAVLTEASAVPEAWSQRAAQTASRVQSTGLAEASMVIRDLTRHAHRSGKPLSSSENAVLQTCLGRVCSELALVLEITEDDAAALIMQAVAP